MMRNNGNRVLEVPELLSSVASQLDNQDRIQLMLVSKHCFRSVGPTIWKSVPRLDYLLRIIKDTHVSFYRFRDSQGAHYEFTEITITLPHELDLTRFSIYAPWIQQLEIFDSSYPTIVGKQQLLQLSTEKPLLPNLRCLTTYIGAEIQSDTLLEFVYLFFCPALTEIRTIIHRVGHHSYMEPASVPAFLQKVHDTCPRIRDLEFYPQGSIHTYNGPDRYYIPCNEYRSTLASLTNLRSFTSTMYILQPETFSVLGNLPHLESLSVSGCWEDDPVLDSNFSIPANWFPSLKELRLIEVHRVDVMALWSQPSLVHKLTSVYVKCNPTVPLRSGASILGGDDWIELFIINLPRLSPNLKELGLRPEDEDDTPFQLSTAARAALRKLGIQEFELELVNGYDEDRWADLDSDDDDDSQPGY